jgi:hypothetical protein
VSLPPWAYPEGLTLARRVDIGLDSGSQVDTAALMARKKKPMAKKYIAKKHTWKKLLHRKSSNSKVRPWKRKRGVVVAIIVIGLSVAALALFVPSSPWALSASGSYNWPIKPFNQQHPIRGKFGDPRISTKHIDSPGKGSLSFHSGVDIAAPDGTAVYAVRPGEAHVENPYHIAVVENAGTKDQIIFGYWHIKLAVKAGQVVSEHQLLGHILAGYGHVHFSEKLGGKYVDPLRRGGLTPYYDHGKPTIQSLFFYKNSVYRNLDGTTIGGKVGLVVNIFDNPPIATSWPLDVLTPSLIQWKLVNSKGYAVISTRTAVDFSDYYTAPLTSVYAPGTIQNGPKQRAVYNFWLSKSINTTSLANGGRYKLTVTASDNRGNTTTQSFMFKVLN